MDFRILVIKNRLKIDILDDLELFRKYEESHTPFKLDFNIIEMDIDVTHKKFLDMTRQDGSVVEAFGTDNVKQIIRDSKVVPEYVYHAVVFLYDLEETKAAKEGRYVAHWCTFNGVYPGTEFIEVATTKEWDKQNDVYRTLTHEIRHAYTNRAKRIGKPVVDYMDKTPIMEDGQLVYKPYYKEFEINAVDGNRAFMNASLAPYWKDIQKSPEFMTFLISLLKKQVSLLSQILSLSLKKTPVVDSDKKTLEEWAEAIKIHEGWYPGSRSYRQNNPGNLRYSKFQTGTDGGFSVFATYDDGFKALVYQLKLAVTGSSAVYKPTMTLLEFFQTYAPSSDNNYPETYAAAVAKKLGIKTSDIISDVFSF